MRSAKPLNPAMLHILIALASQDLHGYGIMLEVSRESDGAYKLGPGTLYDNLQRLIERGLVEETGKRDAEDPRRRYYRLSSSGRETLKTEITRLESVVRRARRYMEQTS